MSSNVSANAPQRANADSVLKVVNLTKQVSSPEGPLAIVHDVTFDIARGETVAITGASGAGKSTLLAMLAGLDLPTSGHVWLDGQDLTVLSEDGRARLRAQRVGFVFQAFHLIPSLTALENVLLPLELAQRDNPQAQAREALDRGSLPAWITIRASSPVANSSAWLWRAPSSSDRPCCSPTNRPAISTHTPVNASSI